MGSPEKSQENILLKNWVEIRDGIIFDLKMINPEDIESFTLTRGIDALVLKVEIYQKSKNKSGWGPVIK